MGAGAPPEAVSRRSLIRSSADRSCTRWTWPCCRSSAPCPTPASPMTGTGCGRRLSAGRRSWAGWPPRSTPTWRTALGRPVALNLASPAQLAKVLLRQGRGAGPAGAAPVQEDREAVHRQAGAEAAGRRAPGGEEGPGLPGGSSGVCVDNYAGKYEQDYNYAPDGRAHPNILAVRGDHRPVGVLPAGRAAAAQEGEVPGRWPPGRRSRSPGAISSPSRRPAPWAMTTSTAGTSSASTWPRRSCGPWPGRRRSRRCWRRTAAGGRAPADRCQDARRPA